MPLWGRFEESCFSFHHPIRQWFSTPVPLFCTFCMSSLFNNEPDSDHNLFRREIAYKMSRAVAPQKKLRTTALRHPYHFFFFFVVVCRHCHVTYSDSCMASLPFTTWPHGRVNCLLEVHFKHSVETVGHPDTFRYCFGSNL